MQDGGAKSGVLKVDVCSLEADIAFFEARLSFAAQSADTAYQRAQIKTYQTLGNQLRQTLQIVKGDLRPSGHDDAGEVSVA